MKIQKFEIEFGNANHYNDNQEPIYYSGQSVVFKVVLDLAEPVKCNGIEVSIEGLSNVLIQSNKSTVHKTLETYLDQKSQIFTPPTEGPGAGHHPAGHAEYQFTFQLPPAAPSSFFEKNYGGIGYSISATLSRPWRMPSVAHKSLVVIRNLYLDQEPVNQVGPYSDEAFLDARCCCTLFSCLCTGRIQANIQLDRRGFVLCEPINIMGEIHNGSCRELNKVTIEIRKKLKFKGKKVRSQVVAAILLPSIKANDSLQLNHQLPVPADLMSSHLQGCSHINLNYFLIIHAHNSICPVAKKVFCELIIGNVKNSQQHQQQQMYQQQMQQQQMQQQQMQQQQMYQQQMQQQQMQQQQDAGASAEPGASTKYEFGPQQQQQQQQAQWIPGYPVLPAAQMPQSSHHGQAASDIESSHKLSDFTY